MRFASFAFFDLCQARSEARVVGQQLLRSGTSVAANYRAVCKARSRADLVSKLGIVEEEVDESVFWLEFLVEAQMMPRKRMSDLIGEAKQLTAIFAAFAPDSEAKQSTIGSWQSEIPGQEPT